MKSAGFSKEEMETMHTQNTEEPEGINPVRMDGGKLECKFKFDYNKPLVRQLFNADISFEEYCTWINEPKHVINPVRDIVLFSNPFMENYLAKTPWWVVPIAWIPVATYNFMVNDLPLLETLSVTFLGLFAWTFMEYMLHRFVFHAEDHFYMPFNRYILVFHFLTHGIHHCFPMDRFRLVFPPVNSWILYLFVFQPLYASVFPAEWVPCTQAGTLIGYIIYDLGHYYVHHGTPKSGYYRALKTYHMQHHYKNGKAGFGVSNKFWDIVFRTEL